MRDEMQIDVAYWDINSLITITHHDPDIGKEIHDILSKLYQSGFNNGYDSGLEEGLQHDRA